MKLKSKQTDLDGDESDESENERLKTSTEVAIHKRKAPGHRKALPQHLPREVIKIELPESELKTETSEQLKVIGWEVSEKLKYESAQLSVVEYHRAKYGVDHSDYVKTAPAVASVIPKGIATPELLAAIITGKYADGLTLYRLEKIFASHEVALVRGTMGRWMVQVAECLTPIRNVLSDRLFESYAIACDETSMQVLKEEGRAAETKSWMIVRMNPVEDKQVVLFDYSVSRNGQTMKELFAGYQGRLLCDGLESYSPLESAGIDRFGCNMHGRRKFEQAATDGANAGKSIARQVMKLHTQIYDSEEYLANLSPEKKVELRQAKQKPLFDQIKECSMLCRDSHR